jgi:hypothetical protein
MRPPELGISLAAFVRRAGWWRVGAAALGVAWLVGLVRLLAANGHITVVFPRQHTPPPGEHNLAAWDLGPTVQASSYFHDWASQHHPAFLVDGRARPAVVEKWASAAADRHPWIEIDWREPHDLARVVITHGGAVEGPGATVRRYRIRCLRDGDAVPPAVPSVTVSDNTQPVAVHPLPCSQARGVRLDFYPNDPEDIVRIFEIEAWGQ